MVYALMIAGAAAERGDDLDRVTGLARRTAANTRTMDWNHIVRPKATNRTPMIREPAPAVVASESVNCPSWKLAYGK